MSGASNPFAPEADVRENPEIVWISRCWWTLAFSTVLVELLGVVGIAGALWLWPIAISDPDALVFDLMLAVVSAMSVVLGLLSLVAMIGLSQRSPWAWPACLGLSVVYLGVFPPTGVILLIGMLDGETQSALDHGLGSTFIR